MNTTDPRPAQAAKARARAAGLRELAAAGGTALDDPTGLIQQAAKAERFADWVDGMIAAHPFDPNFYENRKAAAA